MKKTAIVQGILKKLFAGFDLWLSGVLVAMLAAVFLMRESQLLDWRFQVRYVWQPERQADSNLVVIALFNEKARDSRVTPRDYLARLVHAVSQYQPAVIVLDYDFDEEDLNDPHFEEFEAAVFQAGNVILPCLLQPLGGQYEILSLPPEELLAGVGIGYSTLFEDPVYELPLRVELADGKPLPSLGLAAVAGYLQPKEFFPLRHDQSGIDAQHNSRDDSFVARKFWESVQRMIDYPVAGNKALTVNYFGKIDDYQIELLRAEEFLRDSDAGKLPPTSLANKIVLIGSAFPLPDGSDQFQTPLHDMHGVEVHANIISMLLSQDYLAKLRWGWTSLFASLTIAIVIFCLSRFRLIIATLVIAAFLLFWLLAGFVLFITHNLILPMSLPFQAGLLCFFLTYAWQQNRRRAELSRDFLDFEILAEAARQADHYRLRLIAAPTQAGDAKAEIFFVKDEAFEKNLERLQRGHVDETLLKSFGHALYERLFVGDFATAFERSLTQTRMLHTRLRLRLRMEAPELRTIPWEYLYDQRHDVFLAANAQILLTRYVESTQPRRDLRVDRLNVLIVISNPESASLSMLGMPVLDVVYEKELITKALDELGGRTDLQIRYTILEHALVDEISSSLSKDYHVLHFIGHSTFREGKGKIVLENEDHDAVLLDEAEFSDLFLNSIEMLLVVLNSCKSAATSVLPAVSGLAYRLIERSVPAIVAMQYAVADDAAARFARDFYGSLAGGHPVDLAVANARLALAQNRNRHDFGIPVLFMRARDGRIL